MSRRGRILSQIIVIVLSIPWIVFSIRYGPDPKTSPVLRQAMIMASFFMMCGTLLWSRYEKSHR